MGKVRLMMGSLVGAALIAGSVVPAEARGWGGGRWHRHHDDFDFGDAVGIAALVGAVAIVASSMSKDKKAKEGGTWSDNDDAPPPSREGSDYDHDTSLHDENAAVDACAVAARDQASEQGGYAEVLDIGKPQPIDGGWNIDGNVQQRSGYRASGGDTRRFTCTIRDGRVAEVYLSRDPAAI